MLKFDEHISTDVLVVGGGIGGLNAAIAARQTGADVLVAEKSDTLRSGSGCTGNDHFHCYFPPEHGDDMNVILKELRQSMLGEYHDERLSRHFLEESAKIAGFWHEWGINMKPFGPEFEFMGHAYPGRPRIFLKYDGHNQKRMLTKKAKKDGVKILNHHPVVDLIVKNGKIAGAITMSTSSSAPSFKIIRAKKIILATGSTNRLYPPAGSPGSLFNTAFCPACTGAAQAQAWRIGAKMVNMEMPYRHAGPKFFARGGKSTWIGLFRYPDGKLLGPFVTEATRHVGDITCDVWNSAYTDVMLNGTGPAYIDCSATTSEDLEFMQKGLISEGLSSLVSHMKKKGIDVTEDAVEFMQYEPHLIGRGLEIDINGETSIPSLYAVGDIVGNFRADLAGAAVYGWIAGTHAGKESARGQLHEALEKDPWVEERAEYYSRFMERPSGATWKEANLGLQQIMDSYAPAGPHRLRSETLLKAGLKYLGDLKKTASEEIATPDSHNLMRAIEAMDLIDNGEIIMHAALERKESRDLHRRSDYTFTNPLLNDKFLTVRNENGKIIKEWRETWK